MKNLLKIITNKKENNFILLEDNQERKLLTYEKIFKPLMCYTN